MIGDMADSGRSQDGKFTVGNRVARDARRRRRSEREDRRAARLALRRGKSLPDRPPLEQVLYQQLTYGDWSYEHPGYALTPQGLVSILYGAEQGALATQCNLIDDLKRTDCTLRNLLDQRRGAVASKAREVHADGADGESELAARVLAAAVKDLPMREVLDHLMTHNEYGYAAAEIDWGLREYEGRLWVVPVWIEPVPPQRFTVDPKRPRELRLLTKANPTTGEPLEPGKWWVIMRGPGPVASAGLGVTLAWPALYKRYGTTDWVVYARKFGLPLTIVKIPERASEAVKETAQAIVDNIGSDGGAVVETPADGIGDVTVELHETEGANASTTHGALATYCNREMSKLVNGSTLTSSSEDSGGASYALGQVHADRTWENTQDDTAIAQETFYCSLSVPFVRWNALVAGTRGPCLEIQIAQHVDPTTQMKLFSEAKAMGVAISKTQVRRVTGAREPLGPDDTLGGESEPDSGAPAPKSPEQKGATVPESDEAPTE